MAAEVYQFHIIDAEIANMRSGTLEDIDEIFRVVNFGDGSGNETFIKLDEDNVTIFQGVVAPGTEENEDMSISAISDIKHIATVRPGKSHIEPLQDSEDTKTFLHVRNLGNHVINHALN